MSQSIGAAMAVWVGAGQGPDAETVKNDDRGTLRVGQFVFLVRL